MAWTKEQRRKYIEAKERLIELSVPEDVAVLQYDLHNRTEWMTDYITLEGELMRQRQNTDRTILIGRKLEEPDRMAIFSDENYPHHRETSQGHENDKRRKQIESLRRRINDQRSGKKPKFSSI